MKAIWTIAKLTFREAMRRRILLAGLLLGISFLIIFTIGIHFLLVQIRAEVAARTAAKMGMTGALRRNPRTVVASGPTKSAPKAGRQSCLGFAVTSG